MCHFPHFRGPQRARNPRIRGAGRNNSNPCIPCRCPPVSPNAEDRRRLLRKSLSGLPVLITAAHVPVLAAVPQTASAYGSVLASARPGQPIYRSNPFTLSAAVTELRQKMDAEAQRLASQRSLLGGLLNALLSTLLGLVNGLFGGTTTVAELRVKSPDLYRFLENYRSDLWPVSPTLAFSTAIGQLQNYGNKTLFDVAVSTSSPLGQYFVCAYLNTSARDRIDPNLLWPERVRTIAWELNGKGYFEPTAGIRWDSIKVTEWWRLSLGLSL